jgi:protein-tyrosine-phosphatase
MNATLRSPDCCRGHRNGAAAGCGGWIGTDALMKTVLFACVHNAGRSQMAAAWFNALADRSKARAISAGTDPGQHVHPEVITAMGEIGVDLKGASTTRLTPELFACRR